MSAEHVYNTAAAEDDRYGQCDCGDRYVLGADDHCGECGACWSCCECEHTCDVPTCPLPSRECHGGEVYLCTSHYRYLRALMDSGLTTDAAVDVCVGTGAPRNTGERLEAHVGTPALGSVCTGTWGTISLRHDGKPCPIHDLRGDDRPVFLVTSAPAAYDYQGTHDTGRTEVRYRAECRLVIVAEQYYHAQMSRYLSGAYVAEVW